LGKKSHSSTVEDDIVYKEGQNFDHYLDERLRTQHNYFKKKAKQYRRLYYLLQLIIIFVGAIIPIINLTPSIIDNSTRIASLLGSTIVIATGILQLTKVQEIWILFASTIDALENEFYLFDRCSGDYSNIKDRVKKQQFFAARIEAIIAGKSKKYISTFQSQAAGDQPRPSTPSRKKKSTTRVKKPKR
jgi:hypothetical protein